MPARSQLPCTWRQKQCKLTGYSQICIQISKRVLFRGMRLRFFFVRPCLVYKFFGFGYRSILVQGLANIIQLQIK